MMKRLTLLFLLMFILSCKEQVKELTIFHTNDLHSHMKPIKTDPFGLGGLARMSTMLKGLRSQSPASITVDAGDWSEGSWYYDIDRGANMLNLLSAMGFDAVALGNHDFLQGPDELINTLNRAKVPLPVLAANLNMSDYSRGSELKNLLPHSFIKIVDGIRVGIIGLTTYELIYDEYLAPVRITDVVSVAIKEVVNLRPKVDVLILLSHNSITVSKQLATIIPGIDAVISGHSHVKTAKSILVNNLGRKIPVVETGSWGRFVGELKLSVNLTTRMASYKNYQLHPVSSEYTDDVAIAKMVAEQDAALSAHAGLDHQEVVAESDEDLLHTDSDESPLGILSTQAYQHETNSDMSIEALSLVGVSVPKGPVTIEDLHDVAPHIYNPATGKNWTLNVWNARGIDLFAVMTIFYTTAGLLPFNTPLGWLSVNNADLVWNIEGKVPLLQSLQINNMPFNPATRYKVSLTEGLLASITQVNSKLNLGIDLSQVTNTGIEAWQAIASYAQSLKKLTVKNLAVGKQVRNNTPDLAIYYYDMSWDGNTLSLTVQNNGLKPSNQSMATCYSGEPNKPISYNAYPSDLNTWSSIGERALPPLAPGSSVTVVFGWDSSDMVSGYWPVKCDLTTSGDHYDVNNHAKRVFKKE
ncbi:MAG: hypothetical protein A2Z20_10680 [Bdellovibrionales bacterium RBG_16_40_8]|nr:MAG: hypothetical protein A2Z20_10680 [Bdellovibrionales bacterium RBG_16_40_8]